MKRPEFNDIRTYEEFCKYYWYREELINICKSLSLEYLGNKNELYNIIKSYFEGISLQHKPKAKLITKTTKLSLDTKIIDCGFTFNKTFRDFYINITKDKNFKFTADMVATVKAVKENKDKNLTLGDLLDIKLGKKTYIKFDNSSCQWNKFFKAFCADKNNNIYQNKLKAASKYWAILRDSDLPKIYSQEFIEQNKDKI